MKILFAITALLAMFFATAQLPVKQIEVSDQPVQHGYIELKSEESISKISDPADEVRIFSCRDSAFNISEGKVVSISKISNSSTIVVKSIDHKYFMYRNLAVITLKKGDLIRKGEYLGSIKAVTPGKYEIIVRISTSNRDFSYQDLLEYFRERSK